MANRSGGSRGSKQFNPRPSNGFRQPMPTNSSPVMAGARFSRGGRGAAPARSHARAFSKAPGYGSFANPAPRGGRTKAPFRWSRGSVSITPDHVAAKRHTG